MDPNAHCNTHTEKERERAINPSTQMLWFGIKPNQIKISKHQNSSIFPIHEQKDVCCTCHFVAIEPHETINNSTQGFLYVCIMLQHNLYDIIWLIVSLFVRLLLRLPDCVGDLVDAEAAGRLWPLLSRAPPHVPLLLRHVPLLLRHIPEGLFVSGAKECGLLLHSLHRVSPVHVCGPVCYSENKTTECVESLSDQKVHVLRTAIQQVKLDGCVRLCFCATIPWAERQCQSCGHLSSGAINTQW